MRQETKGAPRSHVQSESVFSHAGVAGVSVCVRESLLSERDTVSIHLNRHRTIQRGTVCICKHIHRHTVKERGLVVHTVCLSHPRAIRPARSHVAGACTTRVACSTAVTSPRQALACARTQTRARTTHATSTQSTVPHALVIEQWRRWMTR